MNGYLIYDLDTKEYTGPNLAILYKTEFGAKKALKLWSGVRGEVRAVEIVGKRLSETRDARLHTRIESL